MLAGLTGTSPEIWLAAPLVFGILVSLFASGWIYLYRLRYLLLVFYVISIPSYFLSAQIALICFSIGAGYFMFNYMREEPIEFDLPTRCERGHDLTGNTKGQCPSCGGPIGEEQEFSGIMVLHWEVTRLIVTGPKRLKGLIRPRVECELEFPAYIRPPFMDQVEAISNWRRHGGLNFTMRISGRVVEKATLVTRVFADTASLSRRYTVASDSAGKHLVAQLGITGRTQGDSTSAVGCVVLAVAREQVLVKMSPPPRRECVPNQQP